MKTTQMTVTEAQKRTVACPECAARAGQPCRVLHNLMADLHTAHRERRAAYLALFLCRRQGAK